MSTNPNPLDLMKGVDLDSLMWVKSGQSPQDACVEVAAVPGGVLVRNSNIPCSPVVPYTTVEMTAFVAGVKDGDFDQFTA